MRTFNTFMKAGPLRNGAERGHGSVWHAVEGDHAAGGEALCGEAPAIMWSSWTPPGQQVTCKKCIKRLAELPAEVEREKNAIHDALHGFDDHGWR